VKRFHSMGWLTAALMSCLALAACGGSQSTGSQSSGSQSSGSTTGTGTGAATSGGATSPATGIHGQLTVGMAPGDIDSLDPQHWYFASTWALSNGLCTPLLRFGDTAGTGSVALVPGLANLPSVSAGGKQYTFTLRPAKFADGQTITGQDIQYTAERMLTPALDGGWGPFYYGIIGAQAYEAGKASSIKGITATANSVTFHLSAADGAFAYDWATPNTCPVAVGTPKKVFSDGSLMSKYASGPFKIASYAPEHSMVWVRNPNYDASTLGARGHLDKMVFNIGVAPSQAALDIKAGSIDLYTGFFNPADIAQLSTDPTLKSQVIISSRPANMYLWLNNTVAPFSNADVRQAVNYAIDRTQAAKAYGGPAVATPASQILTPAVPNFRRENYYPNTPDLAKAKALMTASGIKTPVKTYMWTRNDAGGFVPMAEVIQANLKAIGIDVSIKTAPDAVSSPIYHSVKAHVPMSMSMQSPEFPDGEGIINANFNPKDPDNLNDPSRFHDLSFAPAFEHAAGLPVGSARANAYMSLDQQLTTKAAPVAIIIDANRFDFVSNHVDGYVYQEALDGINYDDLGVK
jgi:peptide/nickel transport system substrate-binding protein